MRILSDNYGRINKEGRLEVYDREIMSGRLESNAGKAVRVVIYHRENDLTHPLRKYYFAVIVPEMQRAFYHMGQDYSRDEIDTVLRKKYLYKEIYDAVAGRYVKEPHTLRAADTEVTTGMMNDCIMHCIRFAIQALDWAIAYPNEELKREDLTDHQIAAILKS